MSLTKNQFVLKALVEEMARRTNREDPEHKEDVRTAMSILRTVLPNNKLYVLATSRRLAHDFCEFMQFPLSKLVYISHPDNILETLRGMENVQMVQLHTGQLTPEQSKMRSEIGQAVQAYVRGAIIWHIGDWRS